MRVNELIRRWAGNILGGFLLLLMAGCWGIPIHTDGPFESPPPKSLVGSEKKIVREKLGQPRHELKNDDKSYFVYRGFGEAWVIGFLLYLPVAVLPSDRENVLYCVLLEFDQSEILRRYDIKRKPKTFPLTDCRSQFWSEDQLKPMLILSASEGDLNAAFELASRFNQTAPLIPFAAKGNHKAAIILAREGDITYLEKIVYDGSADSAREYARLTGNDEPLMKITGVDKSQAAFTAFRFSILRVPVGIDLGRPV